jgi:hypothetical protein
LADSLPVHISDKIGKIPPVERFQTVDASLYQGFGRRDLALPKIASLEQSALRMSIKKVSSVEYRFQLSTAGFWRGSSAWYYEGELIFLCQTN